MRCTATPAIARSSVLSIFATGILTLHVASARPEEPLVKRPPKQNLIVNLAADALVVCTPFGSISDLSGEVDTPAGKWEQWARFDGKIEDLSREEILEGYRKQIDRYAGTQVSHVFLNTNYQRACYPSDAWDSYWDIEDPQTNLTGWQRGVWQIHKKGIDLYAVCIKLCRARGISPWVSMRMNDTHYVNDPYKANSFWKEHPEYRCRQGLNFAIPEVRRHHLNLVEELLARYDIDGIELDWMRFPDHHIYPGAGSTHLNEMMREVRQVADKASKRRGREIQVATRIPTLPDVATRLGMDGVNWVKEGWADMLILSPVWRPSDTDIPIKEWRKRIGEVDRPYRLVAATDLWLHSSAGGKLMLNTPETARGFAATHLDRGADQIYLFNHFNNALTNAAIVRQAGTLESAVGGPRRHILSFHHGGPKPPLPAVIRSNSEGVFHLPIGPKPEKGHAVVRIGLEDRPDLAVVELECRVNDTSCQSVEDLSSKGAPSPGPFHSFVLRTNPGCVGHPADVAPRVLQFEIPLHAMNRDMNNVSLAVKQGGEQEIGWIEIYIEP